MKVTKIRAGLYGVDAGDGRVYYVENRQAPADYGSEWLWYITQAGATTWFDPCYTKREALQVISSIAA